VKITQNKAPELFPGKSWRGSGFIENSADALRYSSLPLKALQNRQAVGTKQAEWRSV